MSEEEELARVIAAWNAKDMNLLTEEIRSLAQVILSSGYAKRGDVVEECARLAENIIVSGPEDDEFDHDDYRDAQIAHAIRALKEPRE